jgi:hypothetical protein
MVVSDRFLLVAFRSMHFPAGFYLMDSAGAAAVTWQLARSRTGKVSPSKCPCFQENPVTPGGLPGEADEEDGGRWNVSRPTC